MPHVCSNQFCVDDDVHLYTQDQACTRETDGNACGTDSCWPWSACGGFSSTCDTTGTQSRLCMPHVCSSQSCVEDDVNLYTQNQPCSRVTDGTSCGSGMVCFEEVCHGGCVISGHYYASGAFRPGNYCQVCDPASNLTAWTNQSNGLYMEGAICKLPTHTCLAGTGPCTDSGWWCGADDDCSYNCNNGVQSPNCGI
jgi:hypothetical protein